MNERVTGKRYSHVHLTRGVPETDSPKARFRLGKLVEDSCPSSEYTRHSRTHDYSKSAQNLIERELGIKFGTRSTSGTLVESWEWYFDRISTVEMLDTISVVAKSLRRSSTKSDRQVRFVKGVARILAEENLAYEVDDLGGVHPLIDAAFSASKQSAISGLAGARYQATADCIENMDSFLLQDPPDYIGAIRQIFGSCENLFKLMYGVPRLDARSAAEKLGKDQQTMYAGHPTLQSVSSKTLEGFKNWINAAHFYRHEQGIEEPSQPAEEVAVLLISQGLSYVRWLAHLDRKTLK